MVISKIAGYTSKITHKKYIRSICYVDKKFKAAKNRNEVLFCTDNM
uniref:Uncharacterized protein n=1 Tax=Anguilla anguilla TaxID=7936 RepID=A0A0E9Y1C4_ANGAN